MDRCFFKGLQAYFNNVCNTFVKANPTRKTCGLQFGQLLSNVWSKSVTADNALSAFKSTEIGPIFPGATAEYTYLVSEEEELNNAGWYEFIILN